MNRLSFPFSEASFRFCDGLGLFFTSNKKILEHNRLNLNYSCFNRKTNPIISKGSSKILFKCKYESIIYTHTHTHTHTQHTLTGCVGRNKIFRFSSLSHTGLKRGQNKTLTKPSLSNCSAAIKI